MIWKTKQPKNARKVSKRKKFQVPVFAVRMCINVLRRHIWVYFECATKINNILIHTNAVLKKGIKLCKCSYICFSLTKNNQFRIIFNKCNTKFTHLEQKTGYTFYMLDQNSTHAQKLARIPAREQYRSQDWLNDYNSFRKKCTSYT